MKSVLTLQGALQSTLPWTQIYHLRDHVGTWLYWIMWLQFRSHLMETLTKITRMRGFTCQAPVPFWSKNWSQIRNDSKVVPPEPSEFDIHTLMKSFLPPATKLGQGYVFTRVCDFVHGGGSAPLHAWIHTTPPGSRPLRYSSCWEKRAISGRYASYWNAILFNGRLCILQKMCTKTSVFASNYNNYTCICERQTFMKPLSPFLAVENKSYAAHSWVGGWNIPS